MSSRFSAFALVASLLVFGALSVALSSGAFAQGDDLWYPGEGVKQDMYVKYRIQEELTNGGRPFEMMLYFQEQDQDGDWIVPTFVVDQGKVIQGTLKLADNMGEIAPGVDVPAELSKYISGYKSSLHWLDGVTTKYDPESLTGVNWGQTASIGGSPIIPSGKETITVPAGTYETTLVMWHKGVDNKVWILNEFPFPIKAETYADVTTGSPPIQYSFELLATGTGKPEAPTSEEQVPTPPLIKITGRGTYEIRIDWEPAEIKPGENVPFTVTLSDSTGFPLERANYDFTVKNANGTVVQEFKNQNAAAQSGTGTHEVQFDAAGRTTITVTINTVNGQPAGGGTFTESVDFDVVVVPEFPVSAAIVAAAVIGLAVVMTRARGTGLGSLFGAKGAI
ncbi:MAG TPA: hypothetical protein VJZ68_08685 [Nitrososphaera sp.]|nr:hypothetical protein [Nitrososphaera sp.]